MRLLSGLVLTVALLPTACGDDGTAESCIEVREPLDPLSIQHVIDPEAVTFQTDPPTSGPHLSGPSVEGLIEQPIQPAAQVRVLEEGGVVVQYTEPDAVDELRRLLDSNEVPFAIAPADSLPAPVVATAWTWKLTCNGPAVERIREFATARVADAPGTD
jgi:hypothetical protein